MTVIRVGFVCSGNICRSPLAEGVFKHQVARAGLGKQFHIESFGVGPWHVGEAPDSRAQQTARRHGLQLSGRAQQFKARDFDRFDHIVALDTEVAGLLRRLAPTTNDQGKVSLLREHDPERATATETRRHDDSLDVPDPYYGGLDGFEDAYRIIERSGRVLLDSLRRSD